MCRRDHLERHGDGEVPDRHRLAERVCLHLQRLEGAFHRRAVMGDPAVGLALGLAHALDEAQHGVLDHAVGQGLAPERLPAPRPGGGDQGGTAVLGIEIFDDDRGIVEHRPVVGLETRHLAERVGTVEIVVSRAGVGGDALDTVVEPDLDGAHRHLADERRAGGIA